MRASYIESPATRAAKKPVKKMTYTYLLEVNRFVELDYIRFIVKLYRNENSTLIAKNVHTFEQMLNVFTNYLLCQVFRGHTYKQQNINQSLVIFSFFHQVFTCVPIVYNLDHFFRDDNLVLTHHIEAAISLCGIFFIKFNKFHNKMLVNFWVFSYRDRIRQTSGYWVIFVLD